MQSCAMRGESVDPHLFPSVLFVLLVLFLSPHTLIISLREGEACLFVLLGAAKRTVASPWTKGVERLHNHPKGTKGTKGNRNGELLSKRGVDAYEMGSPSRNSTVSSSSGSGSSSTRAPQRSHS